MKVPKILYHGTTMLRWHFIKQNGALKSDMRKSIEAQKYFKWNTGYLYFTADPDHAVTFGLFKSLYDMECLDQDQIKEYPNYRDVVVIGVNTSELGDQFDIDPESSGTFTNLIRNRIVTVVQFYRYKGDIKLKHLFLHKHHTFDTFRSNLINKMSQDVHNYHAACNTLMQERQMLNSSSSFLDLLVVMGKVRSVRENGVIK